MSITAGKIVEWLNKLPSDTVVAIDHGQQRLSVPVLDTKRDRYKFSTQYLYVGGLPNTPKQQAWLDTYMAERKANPERFPEPAFPAY